MPNLAAMVHDAATVIRHHWPRTPNVGIVLGTGLGGFAQQIDAEVEIKYSSIPHFPRSTALGHAGHLVCGLVEGLPVVTMEGRFHHYEGYPLWLITLPIRVMNELGIQLLILSNASGGLNPDYSSGDIVVIDDHINLMGNNPLIAINDDQLSSPSTDMSCPYDTALVERALEIAWGKNLIAHRGVYVALTGPNYETRAEYRLLHMIGGDIVGMSTVPEVIVANQVGLRVLALSAVTNIYRTGHSTPTVGAEVVAAATAANPKMSGVVLGILADEKTHIDRASTGPSPSH